MKIIYISGIDGCGKTTQAKLLLEHLTSKGYSAEYQWLRWEPSIIPVIKKLKNAFSRKKLSDIENTTTNIKGENEGHAKWGKLKNTLFSSWFFRKIWLFYATRDYYNAYNKVYKSWTSEYIIMDRYLIDFIIDQSLNYGDEVSDFIEKTRKTAIGKMEPATLSILIDIPARVGYERKLDGTSLAYLEERRSRYLGVPDSEKVLRLDGTLDVNDIQQTIRQWVVSQIKVDI